LGHQQEKLVREGVSRRARIAVQGWVGGAKEVGRTGVGALPGSAIETLAIGSGYLGEIYYAGEEPTTIERLAFRACNSWERIDAFHDWNVGSAEGMPVDKVRGWYVDAAINMGQEGLQ
jgi:hypothetical protein